ncbi:MAG: protein kinase [Lentisphaeria bacterium]|nr:protein kinase [Lentisphaeria bacterium]
MLQIDLQKLYLTLSLIQKDKVSKMEEKEDFSLDRSLGDLFFDEAMGYGLADDIKSAQNNRYSEGTLIAKGGMKSIFNVVDKITGREVAKAMLINPQDPDKVERFFHEARICASLEHPNIVPVYDTGYDQERNPYFTMRLLGGETLQNKVKQSESSTADLIDIFVKICDAVSYAHSQGIIHRDLKPDNIQIGDFGEVQVCDWGLACRDGIKDEDTIFDDETKEFILPVTLDGMIKGTPGYMSPEQASAEKRELTAFSDIYSLGAILYYILTKKTPLDEFSARVAIKKTRDGEVKPVKEVNPNASNSLIAICEKAMALKPEDRYQSVEELKADIVKYQHGFPTAAEAASTWSSTRMFLKRNQKSVFLICSFFIIFNLASVWFLINISHKEKEARRAAKLAQDSERQAIETLEKLMKSEKQARQALGDLKNMTQEKVAASIQAAPRFVRIANMYRTQFEPYKALENAQQALALDPNSKEAKTCMAKVYYTLMNYNEAIHYLTIADNVHSMLLPAMKEMLNKFGNSKTKTYDEVLYLMKLHRKYNFGNSYLEGLIYSPSLNFLTESQRRKLAVETYKFYYNSKGTDFSLMQDKIERYIPQLLYATGVKEFNLKLHKRIKTHLIRGLNTEIVVLPEIIVGSATLKDLEACPNLKKVYFSPKTNMQTYENLKVEKLEYKDFAQ